MKITVLCLLFSLALAGCDSATTGSNDEQVSSGSNGNQSRDLFLARRAQLESEFKSCARTSTSFLPGLIAESSCLEFIVPENRDDPGSREIKLKVMRVPSISSLPEPDPFVILVGGPGQAATEDGLQLVPLFSEIRQNRDILLVDQRGTGVLSPFDCEFEDEELFTDFNQELLLEIQSEYFRECLSKIDASPQYYTTDIAVTDLDAIREYLGYSQLNLWGVSYGTRVALMYLKYFPDHTRSIVIDGVAPPGVLPLQAARDGKIALDQVFELCRIELSCNNAFPELETHYQELMVTYREPVQVSVRDTLKGRNIEMGLTDSIIQSSLFMSLYSRELTRLIPLIIEELYKENFQVLMGLDSGSGSMNVGMHFSVICSEDIPLNSEADLAAAQSDEQVLVFDLLVTPRIEGCRDWPSRPLDEFFFEPVVSDKPALIFSGSQDPVTPARWGAIVGETLSNSRQLLAKGVGHGVFAYGCSNSLIAEFVNELQPLTMDVSCLEKLQTRPFFITTGGVSGND